MSSATSWKAGSGGGGGSSSSCYSRKSWRLLALLLLLSLLGNALLLWRGGGGGGDGERTDAVVGGTLPTGTCDAVPRWRIGNSAVPGSFETLGATELVSSPFMRVEEHRVRLPSGAIVHDWLWMDEPDHINVLVQEAGTGDFLLFEQRKYGVRGVTLATVGGHITNAATETGLAAAKRELLEEMGLESPEWISLGKHRTSANRGGGYCHCFLARGASRSSRAAASDELEQQLVVRLSRAALLTRYLAADLREIKWTATVGLALHWLAEHNQ
jgi:ADP-ribose pyrophosphatase YjhB (NUDIX family)